MVFQKVEIAGSSILGTRKYQQDAYYFTQNNNANETFAIVCDGMGGMQGGEKASQLAISIFQNSYQANYPIQNIPYFFQQVAYSANDAVYNIEENGEKLGAGTTLISVIIRENLLYWVSVGDSHIYIIRNCEIYPCCREHNYETQLNEKYQRGEISAEEIAEDTTRRDALTSYLGIPKLNLIEINTDPCVLQPGDMIILCSDGLYKSLKDEEICRLSMECRMNPQILSEKLTSAAMSHRKGGQDNTTVLVINYWGNDLSG